MYFAARLEPYELLSRIGTGGMRNYASVGEVRKARDTRADRVDATDSLSGTRNSKAGNITKIADV